MKREPTRCYHCYRCEGTIVNHNDTIVVVIDKNFAFFHRRCYDAWERELKKEHHKLGALEEGFG